MVDLSAQTIHETVFTGHGRADAGLMQRVAGLVYRYVIDIQQVSLIKPANSAEPISSQEPVSATQLASPAQPASSTQSVSSTQSASSTPAPQVAPEFLAALTANESGGDPDARRFEPGVYKHLMDVFEGRAPAYGSIRKPTLDHKVAGDPAPADVIRSLATSWGLTQIMGYHMLGRPEPVEKLREPAFHYQMAAKLLREFAAQHHLDLQRDFEALFRCWNTGRPDGRTFDPAYVENGLRRIEVYRQLVASARQDAEAGGQRT